MHKERCPHCRKVGDVDLMFKVEKFLARGKSVLYFCNELHANEHYLEKLRKEGL